MTIRTVGDIRRAIEGLPDDAPAVVDSGEASEICLSPAFRVRRRGRLGGTYRGTIEDARAYAARAFPGEAVEFKLILEIDAD